MAPITFSVISFSNKRYSITVDDSDDVFTLLDAIAKEVGIPRKDIEVTARGVGRPLSQYKNYNIKNLDYLRGNKDLLVMVRRRNPQNVGLTGRTPNTRSITDPSEKRYHSRMLEENFQRLRKKALGKIAESRGLSHNTESIIAGFLGGKRKSKTRKSKKSRRITRRRR